MKTKPQKELKIIGWALIAVGLALFGMMVVVLPAHRDLFNQPWHRQFSTEDSFKFYRAVHRQVLFILFPCIGCFQLWAGWKVLSCAKRISNED